jgi:copper transport protein
MNTGLRSLARWQTLTIACALAIGLLLLFPAAVQAHAVLLRSDPSQDALLRSAPAQVRLWFSEALNPALSTAVVANSHDQRVDRGDAHVSASDPTEMDVSLQSNLPPDLYVVVWRSVSALDGHVLRGSFLFTVTEPDGTIPRLSGRTTPPGEDLLTGGNTGSSYSGEIDAASLFNLIAVTLTDICAIFWVGAQFWRFFVLPAASESPAGRERATILQEIPRLFERRFALPTLLVLLLANLGVLIGQGLLLTSGPWIGALAPSLLVTMITSSRFGLFWLLREVLILLALLTALYALFVRVRSAPVERLLPWLNVVLGLALFMAITMSSHAAAVSGNAFLFAVAVDWLHLLGSAFWIGGMFYIAACYLPILERCPVVERAGSLTTLLPFYSPWAIAGVVLLTITGPFSASFHLTSIQELITTAYGRALLIKILLVGALLATSAFHVLLLRPRLKKEYRKYIYALTRREGDPGSDRIAAGEAEERREPSSPRLTRQVKLREQRLTSGTRRLMTVLRWEPLLGLGVLICVGLMNIFGGTLTPATSSQSTAVQPASSTSKPLTTTATTSDGKFAITLTINPNRFGSNTFTVRVIDQQTRRPTTNVGVTLYLTMTDMDMGTAVLNLQPAANESFSGSGDLSMSGSWQARIQVRTPDNTLHEAQVKFFTPF